MGGFPLLNHLGHLYYPLQRSDNHLIMTVLSLDFISSAGVINPINSGTILASSETISLEILLSYVGL